MDELFYALGVVGIAILLLVLVALFFTADLVFHTSFRHGGAIEITAEESYTCTPTKRTIEYLTLSKQLKALEKK